MEDKLLTVIMTCVVVLIMAMFNVAAILGMANAHDSFAGILAVQAVYVLVWSLLIGAMYVAWWSE